jgi:PBP1b-binding outer membrane lipoprotein LpoB
MKVILAIAVSVLMLSGCKNPNGPQRWSGENGTRPMDNPGPAGEAPPNLPASPPPLQH